LEKAVAQPLLVYLASSPNDSPLVALMAFDSRSSSPRTQTPGILANRTHFLWRTHKKQENGIYGASTNSATTHHNPRIIIELQALKFGFGVGSFDFLGRAAQIWYGVLIYHVFVALSCYNTV
jgi:hypothetical protein